MILPTPHQFELTELLPWFRTKMRNVKLEETKIDYYLNRIKNQQGHLIGTYQEMNQIIHELQGGNKFCGSTLRWENWERQFNKLNIIFLRWY